MCFHCLITSLVVHFHVDNSLHGILIILAAGSLPLLMQKPMYISEPLNILVGKMKKDG